MENGNAVRDGEPTVGKYRFLAPIGHGGMADVYLAFARGPGGFSKLLVVKMLRRNLVDDPEFMAMFMDEARLAARLNHPNVVQTYEVSDQANEFFIAMEFLDGQPLHRVVQRFSTLGEPFPLHFHLRVLSEVLNGLHYAHELCDFDGTPLHVVHRDVTPQNVFLTYSGQVKLMDFGIAKAMGSVAETGVGLFKGKLAYTSPEQARGEAVDRRADIFSAGVMMWEALAGRRMWQDLPEVEIARRLADQRVPSSQDLDGELPSELAAILDRALAGDPADRWQSAAAFQGALEQYLEDSGVRSEPRQIGKRVARLFAEERREMQHTIDAEVRPLLSGDGGGAGSSAELERLRARRRTPDPIPGPDISASHVVGDHAHPDEVTKKNVVPTRRRINLATAMLGGALMSTVVGLGVWWLSGSGTASPADVEVTPDRGVPTQSTAPAVGCGKEGERVVVDLAGDIEEDATLRCGTIYRLKFRTFVRPGATLTIEPGTVIQGDKDTGGTLVVLPGGRLVAKGTPEQPIVFTSSRPAGSREAGDWGGVLLLGNAPLNLRGADGQPRRGNVEGIPDNGVYGGNDPDDDSGVLQYVRIEYAGTELGPNNEINGLTLAGVGRGTTLDHVQVRDAADDCYEFFGGTVDAKYLICQNPGDDGFDFDFGYTGRLQFLVLSDATAELDGSNGVEGDNDPNGSANEPISEPTIFNATLCGAIPPEAKQSYGVLLRRRARFHLANAVVMGFAAGVDVRDAQHLADIRSSVFYDNGGHDVAIEERGLAGPVAARLDDDDGFDEVAWLMDPVRNNRTIDPRIPGCSEADGARLRPPLALTDGAASPPDDGFFDPQAAFIGAFRDGEDRWDGGGWVVWNDVP